MRFSAPIPRPMTAAERAAALASPPARAAAAAALRAPGGGVELASLRDDLPADAAVVDLQPLTDGSILAKVEGHRDGIVVGTTLRMIATPAGWRVGSS